MQNFSRSAMLLGEEGIRSLLDTHVAVFGIGGVGSFASEALARAGIGRLTLVDHDRVSPSNLNRQLVALHSTLGQLKVEAMRQRVLDIRPDAAVEALPLFYGPDTAGQVGLAGVDYIIDAVDTVSAKIALVLAAREAGIPIVSCMGAGNRLDPSRLRVTDLALTHGCPLARVMRRELRARGIEHLTVVCSDEPPLKPSPLPSEEAGTRRATPGSVPFVPPVAGMLAAGVVIRALAGITPAR